MDLLGTERSYSTLLAGAGANAVVYYAIVHQRADEWEEGKGKVLSGSPAQLQRLAVIQSSNSGSLVDFSTGPKWVFITDSSLNAMCGSQLKRAVRVVSTSNGTLATAFANGQTVDGVTLATGDLVLLAGQSTASQNGLYIVAASGAPTRAAELFTGDGASGAILFVRAGTARAGSVWLCTNAAGSDVVGTDALTFVSIGAGTLIGPTTGGTGLTSYAVGDTLYASAANTLAKLAGNTTTTPKALLQTGSGSASAAPAWTAIPTSITGTANQVTASASTGAVTLSLPQSIATTSQVQFANIGIAAAPLSQRGLYAAPVCSGAGNHYGGIYEVITSGTAPSILAGNVVGVFTQMSGGAQTYADVRGLWVNSLNKVQAGDTVTTNYGILVSDQSAGATNFAIYTGAGGVSIGDHLTLRDKDIIVGTTTGTKIGTSTSQKLGFWNKTPIVQPTTGVTGATRVGGGGTALTDTDTFDGYTIAKVVAALRNAGLLA